MLFETETFAVLSPVAVATVATLLVAKIWRECAIESLRGKLHAIECELFELARRGRIGFGDPAYKALRDSIRAVSDSARGISVTRYLGAVALNRFPGGAPLSMLRAKAATAASGATTDERTFASLERLRNRALAATTHCLVFGPVPVEPLLAAAAAWRERWCLARRMLRRGVSAAGRKAAVPASASGPA